MERRRGTSDAPARWEEEEEEAAREERVLRDVEMKRRDRERRELIERGFEERTERRHSREETPYASIREGRSHVRDERPHVLVGEERSHTRVERTRRAAEIAEDDTPEPKERRQQPADDQDIYSHIPNIPPPPAEPQLPEDDASRDSDGSSRYRRRRVSRIRYFPSYAPAIGFVNLLDHQGGTYVFPLDKCASKEVCVVLLLLPRMPFPRLNSPATGYGTALERNIYPRESRLTRRHYQREVSSRRSLWRYHLT